MMSNKFISVTLLVPIFFIVFSKSVLANGQASQLAKEAYHQVEGNVFNGKELKAALGKVKRAQKLDPQEPWVYLTGSLIVLVQGYTAGNWYKSETFTDGTVDNSFRLAKQAFNLDVNNEHVHAHLARLYLITGDYKKAQELLEIAIRRNNESFYPNYFKGILYERSGDTEKAIIYLNRAAEEITHKYQARLVNNHLQKLAASNKDYSLQEKLLKKNIKSFPDLAYMYGNYATFLFAQKRFDEAKIYWEKAIAISPYRHAVKQLQRTNEAIYAGKFLKVVVGIVALFILIVFFIFRAKRNRIKSCGE